MRPVIVSISLLILTSAVLATPPNVRGTAPAHDTADVILEPLWSRGGEDDAEVLFGVPHQVVADHDGRVLVLDNQLSQVHVFAPDGEFLGSLGREGEGPGEFRRPSTVLVMPDGNLAVGTMIRAQFELITPDGVPVGSLHLGDGGPQEGAVVLYGAELRGGTLLAATTTSAFDPNTGTMDRVQNLDIYHPDGRHRAHLADHQFVMGFGDGSTIHETDLLRTFLLVRAVGPDGLVYVPHARDRYLIDVFDPGGTLVMQISRPDFEAPPRTDREHARLAALCDSWERNANVDIDFDQCDTEMAVRGLFVDERGHLFVQHAASHRDLPDGVFLRLDEYARDGTWLREVRLHGVGDPMMDTLFWLGDGRVAVLRGGALITLERWRDAAVYWEGEDEVVPEIVVCDWED